MDKNSIIGFVIIAAILFGFTFYQSHESKKRQEQQAILDSIALANAPAPAQDVAAEAELQTASAEAAALQTPAAPAQKIFKDALLEAHYGGEGSIYALENEKVRIEFNSRGAAPYSALVKDYYNYDSTALYIFKPGESRYDISIYAGEYVKTSSFRFDLAHQDDTSLVFRLPFAGGGYIEQAYVLSPDSYLLSSQLSFVGMQETIPRNVGSFDLDFAVTVPRMEKGYKNELQYSKLDYYFDGEDKPEEMGRGKSASKRIDSKLSWFAFHQQFFSAIMRAPDQFASGQLSVKYYPEEDAERNLGDYEAAMRIDFRPGQEQVSVPFEFYFGPNHYQTLKSYGQKYEKSIPLGGWLVGWFTKYVIIPLFNFLHRYIASFGIIILLMTLIIKLVVFPLTYKSLASSAKMQALKPEIEKINAKYPGQDNAMKKQQATMDLYKRAGVSPMGGCLPTLLTFPILWAMFRFFPASIELRQQSFLWARDLSTYDSILDFGFRIPLIGDHLSLFALLMAVVMWLYSRMTMQSQPAGNDPSAASMKFMTVWMMPIMMFFICNNLSAGLSYYYLLSQLIAIVQTWAIRRSIDQDKILAQLEANRGKPLPKSKWQQRLEEAQKMQQAQARAKGRK